MNDYIFMAITAIAACFAALGSNRSARNMRNMIGAQFMDKLMIEYADPYMAHALRALMKWKTDNGNGYAEKFAELRNGSVPTPDVAELDKCRRHVKFYFERAAKLRMKRKIDDDLFKGIAWVAGINVLYDVVEGLEVAINPKFDKSYIRFLSKKIGRYKHI